MFNFVQVLRAHKFFLLCPNFDDELGFFILNLLVVGSNPKSHISKKRGIKPLFLVGTIGLLCAALELHGRSSAVADRRTAVRLSLVVEPTFS